MSAIHPAFTAALDVISGDAARRAARSRFNDDDWYQLDASDQVVRVSGHNTYTPAEIATINASLPPGHRIVRGMVAKYVAAPASAKGGQA